MSGKDPALSKSSRLSGRLSLIINSEKMKGMREKEFEDLV